MCRFTEEQLTGFTKPASDTEEQKLNSAEQAIRKAINEDPKLSKMSITIFGQGSYANDTNVKNTSDIDINIRYNDGFYYNLPPNTNKEDFGLDNPSKYSCQEFKNDVERALKNYFGSDKIKRQNKCIDISTYNVSADVVPTWKYRRYYKDGEYVEGVCFFTDDYNGRIENYPLQHIENGKNKNINTHKRFKRLTRVYKKIRYKMIDDGENVNDNISSFLLECLVWNVPNHIFNNYNTWTERLKQSIIYLYNQTESGGTEDCKEWGEVSELLYLFRARKWNIEDVNKFLLQMWRYLQFK